MYITGHLKHESKRAIPPVSRMITLTLGLNAVWTGLLSDLNTATFKQFLLTNFNLNLTTFLIGYDDTKIHIFFLATGNFSGTDSLTFGITNSEKITPGYASNDKFIAPLMPLIPTERLRECVDMVISNKYETKSFMYRQESYPALPLYVLSKGTLGGDLADMRNIHHSEFLADEFVRRGWKIVWYKNANGEAKRK